ncbi:hypothetical protein AB0D37_16300, partial [Streptomyces sp. NPDC048384]
MLADGSGSQRPQTGHDRTWLRIQRRSGADGARIAYDAFLKSCPTNQLLDRLSDKWVSLVVA